MDVLSCHTFPFLQVELPNVTVRGAPLTELKRSRRTLIKTKPQNRQRAARPFDRLVRPSNNCQSQTTTNSKSLDCPDVWLTPNLRWTDFTTGAKTGQLEKAEDNGQATEATKFAKPKLRTRRVTNPPEKQNPTLNRNSPTWLVSRSGKAESTQP